MIGLREVRCEETQSGEVDLAAPQALEHLGDPPCRPRDLDAVVGSALGEPQRIRTEDEEAGERAVEVEAAGLDLLDVLDDVRLELVAPRDQGAKGCDEIVVGEPGECSVHEEPPGARTRMRRA